MLGSAAQLNSPERVGRIDAMERSDQHDAPAVHVVTDERLPGVIDAGRIVDEDAAAVGGREVVICNKRYMISNKGRISDFLDQVAGGQSDGGKRTEAFGDAEHGTQIEHC